MIPSLLAAAVLLVHGASPPAGTDSRSGTNSGEVGTDFADFADTIDPPPASEGDRDVDAFESTGVRVIAIPGSRRRPAEISVAPGETVFVEARIPLPRRAPSEMRIQLRSLTRGNACSFLQPTEPIFLTELLTEADRRSDKRGARRRSTGAPVTVRAAIRPSEGARACGVLRGRIDILSLDGRQRVARQDIELNLTLTAHRPMSTQEAAALVRAHRAFESRALAAFDAAHVARANRSAPEPDNAMIARWTDEQAERWATQKAEDTQTTPTVPPEARALEAFFAARLRADITRQQLRDLARNLANDSNGDPHAAEVALLALGALPAERKIKDAALYAAGRLAPRDALDLARTALSDLRIDEAEGLCEGLRTRGRMSAKELASALALQGGVLRLRGRVEQAEQAFGQALSLEPHLESPFELGLLKTMFENIQRVERPGRPIAIRRVSARVSLETRRIEISVEYQGDDFGLIAGGDIQIWGTGGGAHSREDARAHTDHRRFTVQVPLAEGMLNYDHKLLLKAHLRDVSGIVLASFGEPTAQPVPTSDGPVDPNRGRDSNDSDADNDNDDHDSGDKLASSSTGVAWWVLAIVGGLVVVGSATAGIILATKDDTPERGIGPINIAF